MFRIFVRCFTVAAICVTGISAGAFATQINSLSVNSGFCTLSAFDSFSTTSGVETNFNASDGQCAFSTIARAGGGSVGIDLGLVTTPGLGGLNATVTVETEALIEVTIGVPENFGGGEIPVSFTPHLSGDVAATIVSGDGFLHAASASVTAFASIAGSRIDGSNNVASRNVEARADVTNVSFVGSPAASASLPEFLAPSEILVDPLSPIEVLFRLTAVIFYKSDNVSFINANVNSLNSLSFALSGPALILPDGFTANSEFGSIVDNQFASGVSALPLPATLPLFGSGLAIMSFMGWRRKRTFTARKQIEDGELN